MIFILMQITHFQEKGCALGLILKVRVSGTRKWPKERRAEGTEILNNKLAG